MRTLLNLFFVPYLRFLLKFHFYAFCVAGLAVMLRVEELLMILPFLYFFGLYTTSNRHQFKDNISWMLASFNKKTLISYHVMAQSMVLLLQLLLTSLVMVIYVITLSLVMPESSDQILPDLSAMGPGKNVIAKSLSSESTTKEYLSILCAVVFFLITMFSPVSLKDYLRQMEEQGSKWGRNKKMMVSAFYVVALCLFVYIRPDQWLIPLLSMVLITELYYVIWIYNRAFVLFHEKHHRRGLVVASFSFILTSGMIYQHSLNEFRHGKSAEVKLAELKFLGALAPTITSDEFVTLARSIKEPRVIAQMIGDKRFGHLIPNSEIERWVLDAKELSVAIRLIEEVSLEKLSWLNQEKHWEKLELLFNDLHSRNPASAAWQARRLENHLVSKSFKLREIEFEKRGALEQYVSILWWKKFEPQKIAALDKSALKPALVSMYGDLSFVERAPASGR
jgi:hypothetical protein